MKAALLIALLIALPAFATDLPPTEPAPEPTHIAVPVQVINAMLQTLQQRPYAEVANVIDAYRQSAQPITITTEEEPAP